VLEAQELQAIGDTQQVEALMINPRLSGYVLTQLNDLSWEFHAGILDVWRNPKLSYHALKRLNQPQVMILKAEKDSAFPGETVAVDIAFVSRCSIAFGSQVTVRVFNPLNEEIDTSCRTLSTSPGIQILEGVNVPVEMPGEYQIRAWLEGDSRPPVESMETILGLSAIDWNDLPVKPVILGERKDTILSQFKNLAAEGSVPQESIIVAAHPATLSREEWTVLFDQVESGKVALIGALRPADKDVIQTFAERGIHLNLHFGIGSWMGCYHWIPDSEFFTGLPSRGLAKKPYTGCIPKYVLSELGGSLQAGSMRNTQTHKEPLKMLWFSDIETIALGAGKLIFCQYRIFDGIGNDAVSTRLAYNFLKHGAG